MTVDLVDVNTTVVILFHVHVHFHYILVHGVALLTGRQVSCELMLNVLHVSS